MREFFWCYVTGVLLLAGPIVFFPAKFLELVVLAPAAGFLVHQTARLRFERKGGYAQPERAVIERIRSQFAPKFGVDGLSDDEAFLLWETTFYSDAFPASFREHDHRAWFAVLALRGMALAARAGAAFCFVVGLALLVGRNAEGTIVAFAVMGVDVVLAQILGAKAATTQASLFQQEAAVLQLQQDLFATHLKRLHGGKGR